MKQVVLFLFISLFSLNLGAQTCVPAETFRDSAVGVYPPPDPEGMDLPDQGITLSACINSGYEFVLTFKIPPTINFNGVDFGIDSIVVKEDGVQGLPAGLSFGCNPENCVFSSITGDSIACLVIYGEANDTNAPGDYELTIDTDIWSSGISLPLSFPNTTIPNADGQYILKLEEEGSMDCFVTSTDDYLTQNIRISNTPNPFSYSTLIEVYSDVQEDLDFKVFDLMGKVVHQNQVTIFEGENNFEFDGSNLSNGIYTFSLSNAKGTVTRKMVISR